MGRYYAHTPNAQEEWHDLASHLEKVAWWAEAFAQPFGGEAYAAWVGLIHDLGKFNPSFQEYLQAQYRKEKYPRVPHAMWGGALIYCFLFKLAKDPESWKDIALPVCGHHSGLAAAGRLAQDLEEFLQKEPGSLPIMKEALASLPKLPPFRALPFRNSTRRELFIRMLFSALVDADYLDTEAHFAAELTQARRDWPEIPDLWIRFMKKQESFLASRDDTTTNRIRREVYEACLQAAEGPPGIWRLTVPTGGGKTRSGLAFALKHAVRYGKRRVIVAIPYTSIIEQTADAYRKILGNKAVLEHHSQVPVSEDEGQDPSALRMRLAAENWDAPIIVTTTVQLLESLFSNRPSRARKLHNLAQSVILLDEVQALPPEILKPTLDVLRALVEEYGVTLVLSTATQPTFDDTPYLQEFYGLEVREIVPQYRKHFQLLKRVAYELREEPLSWERLADEIRELQQVLVVLNSRRDVLELLKALDDLPDVFHLSTLLCGAHRRRVLDEVSQRLGKRPVRLVSTQVVEAGVDLDFPVVYRAVGPLDRVVQAAGRCNREGRLAEGRVVVFEPAEGRIPRGPYKAGLEKARILLRGRLAESLHDPELYRQYFRRLFADVDLDRKKIQEYRRELNYPEVARLYRLIEEETVSVVVPYGEAWQRLEEWMKDPGHVTWQRLQPYLVSLFRFETAKFKKEGLLEPLAEGLYRWTGGYDERLGLVGPVYDPGDLIV
ncbi:MAG: CRISPR-associated endonuclease/helicase Cas3 [Moorella sp. (in: firmicutes)]|jgi:CRISPR-associated endonuclease/helicase Cas3|uniref:CRISPR-associated helicase Cas3' n=1 Tax=Moorella sp. E306M TaxID=2572683 RepID=UPI0010FFAE49|nr:CRISPR-associated helicase Cas3' [Moorella sp. E306M]MDK2817228.1 CRISPR-associated endonuclease/helicase Cas3 [Moorella sp. (in: firmicutes)]GEA17598.1 CRISPR-associated helicase/endonuclease Cas3 [Moorella sp. E306M]